MDEKSLPDDRRVSNLIETLQSRGRYTFTRTEALRAGGRSEIAFESALRRLRKRHRIASPRRGFHVVVPPEYREAGSPPATWFIDDLMRHLQQPYYVGLLSAASIHGAAHQQPMVFQVVTDRPTRPVRVGRVRIAFTMSRTVTQVSVSKLQTETGFMRVSTPETTAFDLVRFAPAAGHLSNVATTLSELSDKVKPAELARAAELYAVPDVQRLGYVLEHIGAAALAESMWSGLAKRRFRPVLLARGQGKGRRHADTRWRVIPNEEIEAET